MQRNKIRIGCLGLCILCCAVLLAGCPGLSDWCYQLPNEYSIVRCNSIDIVLSNNSENGGTVIDGHIKAFCYNDSFVGIQRIAVSSIDAPPNFDPDDYENDELDFYLVHTESGDVHGPYSKSEYTKQCEELQVGTLCEWIYTTPKPSGKEHEKHLY